MSEELLLRRATERDFDFAWRVYSEALGDSISEILDRPWDDDEERERFRTTWLPDRARVVALGGYEIGWLAIREDERGVELEHGYLLRDYQRRGIGSQLLGELLEGFDASNQRVRLSILKTSPAKAFFEKFGFEAEEEDATTLHMSRKREQV